MLATVLSLVGAATAWASESWVRIDGVGAELRAALPVEAIDYGSFVWLPAERIPPGTPARGQRRFDNPFLMSIDHHRFDPAEGFPELDPAWMEIRRSSGSDFHLVQFQGPIKTQWLEQLRADGLEPVQYLAPFGYIVWGTQASLARGLAHERVRFAGDFPPNMRVPYQSRNSLETHAHSMVMIYQPMQRQVLDEITDLGIRVIDVNPIDRHFSVAHVEAAPGRFLQIARVPGVFSIQHIASDGGPRGEMSAQSVAGGFDGDGAIVPGYRQWLTGTSLDGNGIITAVVDGGVRESHVDLADRMQPCVSAGRDITSCTKANDSHGTHVAGAIAGTGASGATDAAGFLRGLGIAPSAGLVQQRYVQFLDNGEPGRMVPEGMLTIFLESSLSGARLANNSWGPSGTPQGYDIPTRQVDIITRDADPETEGQQAVLPIWAIMNGNGDSDGVCAPSSLGSPDEGKNLLTVGSTRLQATNSNSNGDVFDISSNSAHGPACDGRRVPQVVAPGCQTDSTTSNSDSSHGLMCGTSMAAPVVTGAAVLYTGQHTRRHGKAPSPAMIRAVIAASARDLAGQKDADELELEHRPDRKQGWGRLDLAALVQPTANLSIVDQSVTLTATGQSWSGNFDVHRSNEPVRIMLAWTDAPGPGTGGTTPAWVNDLDLIVEVDGTEYLGNAIDPDSGLSVSTGDPDTMNNLEGVMLSPAQHKGLEVRITVLAANIAADALDPWEPHAPRQDFALAAFNLGAPGEPTALRYVNEPVDVAPQEPWSPVDVELIDVNGQRVTSHPGWTVEIELIECDGTIEPDGTHPLVLGEGLVTFDDLSTDRQGRFRLRSAIPGSGIESAVSEPFAVDIPALFRDRFEFVCVP